MNGLYTIGLLVVSNIFMTFAWYGHIKLQQMKRDNRCYPLVCHHLVELVAGFGRIHLSGSCQPLGVRWQWWQFLVDAVEGHPGSHIALGFHSLYGRVFQW